MKGGDDVEESGNTRLRDLRDACKGAGDALAEEAEEAAEYACMGCDGGGYPACRAANRACPVTRVRRAIEEWCRVKERYT